MFCLSEDLQEILVKLIHCQIVSVKLQGNLIDDALLSLLLDLLIIGRDICLVKITLQLLHLGLVLACETSPFMPFQFIQFILC